MLIPSSKLQQVTCLQAYCRSKNAPVASRIGGRRLERRCGPSRCEQQQSKSEDGIDESPECPSRLAVYGRRETHSRDWGLRSSAGAEGPPKLFELVFHRFPRRPAGRPPAFDALLPAAELLQCRSQRRLNSGSDIRGHFV